MKKTQLIEGQKCIGISNSNGIEWAIPEKRAAIGFAIYQPVTIKGKLIKSVLPLMIRIGFIPVRHVIKLTGEYVPASVIEQIRAVFPDPDLYLSFFSGTPGPHKKPTVQIFSASKILGYAKYTKNEAVKQLFDNEQMTLQELHKNGIHDVPECLFNGKTEDGYYVFIQSTQKSIHSRMIQRYSLEYQQFIKALADKTSVHLPFTYSQYYKTLEMLKQEIQVLAEDERELIMKVISLLEAYYSGKSTFCVSHRDFKIWNTCQLHDRLYVFDWEYARLTYPPLFDDAAIFVSIGKHERRLSDKEIVSGYQKANKSVELLYSYLLDKIHFYLERGGEKDLEQVRQNVELLRTCFFMYGEK